VTGKPSQLYHPVPMLSLWLQAMVRSGSLTDFRLANLALHGLCAGLLCLFLVRRGSAAGRLWPLLRYFSCTPSVTEPVMWITGRHDTLGMAFMLTAILLWPVEGRGIWLRSSLAGLAATMAFLCKEQFLVVSDLAAALQRGVGTWPKRRPVGTAPLAHPAAAVRWPGGGSAFGAPASAFAWVVMNLRAASRDSSSATRLSSGTTGASLYRWETPPRWTRSSPSVPGRQRAC